MITSSSYFSIGRKLEMNSWGKQIRSLLGKVRAFGYTLPVTAKRSFTNLLQGTAFGVYRTNQ